MHNIWEVLWQTLDVSVLCLLLLLLKTLFLDKLSPRWQYGVWSLLVLRLLIPVGLFGRYVFASLPLYLEVAKTLVEDGLGSSYATAYGPMQPSIGLPVVSIKMPHSWSDWLFLLYVAGVLFMLGKTLLSYLRLRALLKRGEEASTEAKAALARVCQQYALKSCPVVELDGLPSAFVCGVVRPVLALPKGALPADSVLLHELLHHRARDPLQSLLWGFFRALHWFNPFLQHIVRTIGNDMESLCDQRVLERLEGEDRRAYGNTLLTMTNERYPRAPGTSSISNGGHFIAKRIEAIVRFQKYPKGMALVSICIVVVLFVPFVLGADSLHFVSVRSVPGTLQEVKALTEARLQGCSTVAGAMDVFIRGILEKRPVYLAAVTPPDEQEAFVEALARGELPAYVSLPQLSVTPKVELHNVKPTPNGDYEGILLFSYYFNSPKLLEEASMQYLENSLEPWLHYKISVRFEKGRRWTVRTLSPLQEASEYTQDCFLKETDEIAVPGGRVQLLESIPLELENQAVVQHSMFESARRPLPDPNGSFRWAYLNIALTYHFEGTADERAAISTATLVLVPLYDKEEIPDVSTWDQALGKGIPGGSGGGNMGGYTSYQNTVDEPVWDGQLYLGYGSSFDAEAVLHPSDMNARGEPLGYAIQLRYNGVPTEPTVFWKEGGS